MLCFHRSELSVPTPGPGGGQGKLKPLLFWAHYSGMSPRGMAGHQGMRGESDPESSKESWGAFSRGGPSMSHPLAVGVGEILGGERLQGLPREVRPKEASLSLFSFPPRMGH